MRRLTGLLVLLSLTAGCQIGGNLGGGDPGWQYDDAPFEGAPESSDGVLDTGFANASGQLSFTEQTCTEDEDAENALVASVDAAAVTITHSNIGTWCEAAWTGSYQVETDTFEVFVSYDDTSGTDEDTAACWCNWDLSYAVDGLAPGDWTLYALEESVTFTLE